MSEVPNECAKCGEATAGGQFYRFYFGVVVDVDSGTTFQAKGSEEVYYCDRCVVRAAMREEKFRSIFFLILGLSAIVAVVFLVLVSGRGLWASLVALLVVAVLGGAAYRRYRRLHTVLHASVPDQLRHAVRSNEKLQDMGDAWAIARRRAALQDEGAELFLTRKDSEIW